MAWYGHQSGSSLPGAPNSSTGSVTPATRHSWGICSSKPRQEPDRRPQFLGVNAMRKARGTPPMETLDAGRHLETGWTSSRSRVLMEDPPSKPNQSWWGSPGGSLGVLVAPWDVRLGDPVSLDFETGGFWSKSGTLRNRLRNRVSQETAMRTAVTP